MSSELDIEYFTPEFNQFREDVLKENLLGIVVTKLPFAPLMAEDFKHNGIKAVEAALEIADIIITIGAPGVPAKVMGKSQAGKTFLKTRKYSCMR